MKKILFVFTIVLAAITIGIFFPLSLRSNDALPNAIDPVFYAWNLFHNVQSVSRGFGDLLDTNIFYPQTNTLALSDTLYAQTLLTAPIIFFTKNPILAENIYIFSTFPLAALAMFFLSYYLTDHLWASLLSGIFYAFSYPRISQIGHMPALSSQWLPLVFLYLIKYIREGKLKNLLYSFFWYAVSMASTIYFGVFLIPLAGITLLIESLGISRINVLRMLKELSIIFFPAIVILVIITFPYIRLRAENPGISRVLEDSWSLSFSAIPADYLSVLPTSWLGDIGFRVTTNEHPLYPSLTLMVLAGLSVFFIEKKQGKSLVGFAIISTAAFFFSLGPYANLHIGTIVLNKVPMPYYYLYNIFPLLQSVRVPARFSIFVILGLSVCAAFTLKKLLIHPKRMGLGIMITLIFLTEIWQVQTAYVPIPLWKDAPAVYHFIDATPDTNIIVELPLHPEWLSIPMENQLMKKYEDITENDVYAMETYRTYYSAFHRKRMFNGYSSFFPTVYHDHSSVMDKFPTPDAIRVLQKEHVRYILIHASEYTNVPYSDIEREIQNFPILKKVVQFGTDYVYELDTTK